MSKNVEDGPNFCGLLRMYELYMHTYLVLRYMPPFYGHTVIHKQKSSIPCHENFFWIKILMITLGNTNFFFKLNLEFLKTNFQMEISIFDQCRTVVNFFAHIFHRLIRKPILDTIIPMINGIFPQET